MKVVRLRQDMYQFWSHELVHGRGSFSDVLCITYFQENYVFLFLYKIRTLKMM